jgi:hypothetical protein
LLSVPRRMPHDHNKTPQRSACHHQSSSNNKHRTHCTRIIPCYSFIMPIKLYLKGVTNVDVLLGRGSGICDLAGNKHFRNLVEQYKDAYSSSHRNEKNRIGNIVLHSVQSEGGRFLAFDDSEQEWKEVPGIRALEKSMQALREQSVRSPSSASADANEKKQKPPRKKRLSFKTPKKTGTTTTTTTTTSAAPSNKITPTPAKKKQSRKLKSPPNNSSKNLPSKLKSFPFHPSVPAGETSTTISQQKFRALFPMMKNNRMPTTSISSFLPSATKRRFTTGHPPPPTAAWEPGPQDTAAHDMVEMTLLAQEIYLEQLERIKYKYVPETPPAKKN